MAQIIGLHGFTGESDDFDPLRSHLAPKSELISPDLPGHGMLKRLRELTRYSIQAHLDIISQTATESTITLLGYSMGGRIALHWALAHPERIGRLVLIGASPGLPSAEERTARQFADSSLANFIRKQGLEAFLEFWHNQSFFQPLLQMPKELLDPILMRRRNNDPEGLALSLENVGTGMLPSLWHRLHEIRCPVDIVTGESDVKFTQIAREMGAIMPNVCLSVFADAGHAVHLERPDDLAALLE